MHGSRARWIPVLLVMGGGLSLLPRPVCAAERDAALQTYLSANGLLNRGLHELAVAEYRKFLSQHPTHEKAGVARYGLGVSLFRMQNHAEAVEALTPLFRRARFDYAAEVGTILGQSNLALGRHAEAAKAFAWVTSKLGDHKLADDAAVGRVEALYLDGQHAAAVDAGQEFISRWPGSPLRERAEFFHALATMAQRDFAKAAERFEAQVVRFPNGPFAHQASLLLAQCRQNAGSLDGAVGAYRKVLGQAESRFVPDALFGLATLLLHLGHPGEAGEFLDRLLSEFPDSDNADAAVFHRGRVWFDQEEFDRAAERFQQAMEGDSPLVDQATYWLAKCELRRGDFAEAAQRLEGAMERFPECVLLPEMHYDRGVALIRAERLDPAIEALSVFRRKFPDHELVPEALRLSALTEHERRRFAESQTFCRAFLDRFDTHDSAASVAFLSGENEFLAGNHEASVTAFRQFLLRFPDDPQAQRATLRLGTSLHRLDRLDEARDQLARIAKAAESNDLLRPALLSMGDISFQRSEWKSAEAYLEKYLAGGDVPLADDALLKLGLSRQRDGRPAEAVAAYDRLIDRHEDSPHRIQAMFERGQALVAMQRLDDASRAFEAVLAADGNSRFAPYALNHLAAIAAQRGRLDESSELYARVAAAAPADEMKAEALFQRAQTFLAAEQFEEADKAFSEFISRFPNHARRGTAHAKRAIAISRQDRFEDALEAIRQAEPFGRELSDKALATAVAYEKAWCLRKLGRDDEAARAYRQLTSTVEIDSISAHAMLEQAEIEYAQERYADAAALLRRVHDAAKDRDAEVPAQVAEQSTYRLALSEFKLDQFERAAGLFEEFLTAYPDSPLTGSACFYGGESLVRLGRHERAVKYLSRVPREFASDPVCEPSLLRLGEALATLQRWAASEQAFTDFFGRFADSPHWFQARFGLGWARENQRRYDEAIGEYRTVVDRHQGPTAARAQFQIGECLFAQGKHEEAVREFLKVDILFSYPEWSAAALFEAGRCFEKLGKVVEARNHFRLVAERHGQSRWAAMAAERLSALSAAGLPGK